ncbi:MAG: MazG nucleotide pyrophosphohydrolase domain-containing protein [Candidatus Altimarinota bacterium]
MKKVDLENLFSIIEEKYFIDNGGENKKDISVYWKDLEGEIEEVKEELKQNNSVYLEDELGDIFRCYINLLKKLEKEGYIESLENVFSHADKKFSQRINGRKNGISWQTTKEIQKQELKKEHDLKYNS